ncbi:hypothetical protein L484_000259 [Morus notabilis]|uniref:Uncharacterized protein n=1 Tax=Morus notabilis TaxID=981085 RepID=W9SNS5_9ROSA|nr:hypothetical protein L484_000259 [Morus notabilis]
MEQKGFLLSALGVGVGVGVGLGLASGQAVSKWAGNVPSNAITLERMEQEMLRLVVDGRDSKVTFDDFPYFLSTLRFRVIESRVVFFRELQRIKFLIVNFPGIYIVVVLLYFKVGIIDDQQKEKKG